MSTHVERRRLPYTARQLFDLVADIEKYPQFIDRFVTARILRREGNVLKVEQTVRVVGVLVRFTTRAVLDPTRQIVISSTHPLFSRFDQRWTFAPAPDGGVVVEYESILELRSRFLQRIMAAIFDEHQIAEAMVSAFMRRARQIYGHAPTGSVEHRL